MSNELLKSKDGKVSAGPDTLHWETAAKGEKNMGILCGPLKFN